MCQKSEHNQSSSIQNSSPSQSNSSVDKPNGGKWSKLEHQSFLIGLRSFGKDWDQISTLVKTRTESQVRSHAQKYLNKQQRLNTEIGKCEKDLKLKEVSSEIKVTRNKVKQGLKMTGMTQEILQEASEIEQCSKFKSDDENIIIDEGENNSSRISRSASRKNKKIKCNNKKIQDDPQRDFRSEARSVSMCDQKTEQSHQLGFKLASTPQMSRQTGSQNFQLINVNNGILFPCWKSYFFIPDQVWRNMLFSMKESTNEKESEKKQQNKGFQLYKRE